MGHSEQFIQFAIAQQVLRFGSFKTKAGRLSPYFFNAGLFNDGISLGRLADFYAQAVLESAVEFDMLFGPAYKGIPLAATLAVSLAKKGRNVPFSFNRKEAKDHGEGGMVVGASIQGRVLIIDDVISAGTSIRESVELIESAGGKPSGVLIAIDRMEKGQGQLSAVQEVQRDYGIPVIPIATLNDLMHYLSESDAFAEHHAAIKAYRESYGVA